MIASFLIMSVLSAGNIILVHSGVWDVNAGTPVDLSGWDTAAYQVDGVSRSKDGGYIVSSRAAGFQSDIAVAVTFDAAGAMIRKVEVTSQAETEGIGTKITEAAFLEQFLDIQAPVGLRGRDTAIVSPKTGAVWGSTMEDQIPEADTGSRSDPEEWNFADQSPEAEAVRNLYRAGLLASAMEQQPLKTAFADTTPEEQAAYRLAEAGLAAGMSKESGAGMPAESIAENKLNEAGLTAASGKTQAAAASADFSEIDAVSAATVSSGAVVQAVDQAYFFLQENILN